MFLYGANKPHSSVYLFYQFCKSDIGVNFVSCMPHLVVPSSANKDYSAKVSARVAINRDMLMSRTAMTRHWALGGKNRKTKTPHF